MLSLSAFGIVLAAVMYAVAASPSLLPRSPFWHGFVTAPFVALGYFAGDKLEWWVVDLFTAGEPNRDIVSAWSTILGLTLSLVAAVAILFAVRSAFKSAREVAEAVGTPPPTWLAFATGGVAMLIMAAIDLQLIEILWALYQDLRGWLVQYTGMVGAAFLAILAPAIVAFIFGRWFVYPAVMGFFVFEAKRRDSVVNPYQPRPTVKERSGSDHSLNSWETIGAQGRQFLSRGPSGTEIAEVTGEDSLEPIRIYAGVGTDKDASRADLDRIAARAVADMKRAGGFERSVINVATATGSGWVNEWLVQPLEYLTRGDCATISMQYSSMFSAVILLRDLELCRSASIALYEAVNTEIQKMPPQARPKLIMTGESLGAFGSQGTFAELEAAVHGCDGAIWVGTPRAGAPSLWRKLTETRDPGSSETLPIVDAGRHVRFIDDSTRLRTSKDGTSYGPWEFPRLVYVQHPSDPVVWYNPRIIVRKPDWLKEPRGQGVSPTMNYVPLVTLVQIVVDLPVAGTAPDGRGHTYGKDLVPVWTEVLGYDQPARVSPTWLQTVNAPTLDAIVRAIAEDENMTAARDKGLARQSPPPVAETTR